MKRIVKLHIEQSKANDFKLIFENSKSKILAMEGCNHVELLEARGDESIFFTFSIWDDEKALNNYRNSETFKSIWEKTKKLFDGKPAAWSVDEIA